ncbi:MAG: DUF2207 domain-containing protein [Acidimicrobiales bacterium]|nr:DUF2207 domain-containing protein [Acidimicrobiales bacterium]
MFAAALVDDLLADLPRTALWVLAAVSAAGWLLAASAVTWFTRPRLPAAGPTGEQPGPGTLALGNFLVHRGALTPTAVSGVVLDLAARRLVAVEEIGDGRQLVRYFPQRAAAVSLDPVEATVLELIRGRLGPAGTVPVGELSLGDETAASRWWKRFDAEVVAEGRRLGLLRRRWPTGARLAMALGLLVPAVFAALAVESGDAVQRLAGATGDGTDLGGGSAVALFGYVALLAFANSRLRAWVTTPLGDTAAARWLGARTFFAEQPGLAEAPPAAVVVRGRHLAAAVALGVAPVAAQRLPIGPQRDDVAWVQRGGLWREVTIRYPPGRRRSVGLELAILWSLAQLAAGLLGVWADSWFVRTIGVALLDAVRSNDAMPWALRIGLPAVFLIVPTGFAAASALLALRSVRDLAGGLADLGHTTELVGPVLRAPTAVDDEGHRAPTGFLAVDDGRSDELLGVYCPKLGARQGQRVRLVITPRLGVVRHGEILPGNG